MSAPHDPVTALNQACHCITLDAQRMRELLEASPATAGVYHSILQNQPNLFSASPVFLARHDLARMEAVIAAVEAVVRTPGCRSWVFSLAPTLAHVDRGPRGVFLGYDFHLGPGGAQLIEINTNAGGGLLNAALGRAQRACCEEVEAAVAGIAG